MNLETISGFFIQAFPEITPEQQQLSLALYGLLAQGNPATANQLSEATGQPTEVIRQTLQSWNGIFFNEQQYVTGFWGITIQETPHRMTINERAIYTWCAWDTLFIPLLLNKTARVNSRCPVTGNHIELNVTPAGVRAISNKSPLVSFLIPDMNALKRNITTSFCQFVHFFDSPYVAEQWTSEHPGTFLLSLDDAFLVGKQVNKTRYQDN